MILSKVYVILRETIDGEGLSLEPVFEAVCQSQEDAEYYVNNQHSWTRSYFEIKEVAMFSRDELPPIKKSTLLEVVK